jgi:hypothetical protein
MEAVQNVRGDNSGSEPADNYTLPMEMGLLIITKGQAFSYTRESD